MECGMETHGDIFIIFGKMVVVKLNVLNVW